MSTQKTAQTQCDIEYLTDLIERVKSNNKYSHENTKSTLLKEAMGVYSLLTDMQREATEMREKVNADDLEQYHSAYTQTYELLAQLLKASEYLFHKQYNVKEKADKIAFFAKQLRFEGLVEIPNYIFDLMREASEEKLKILTRKRAFHAKIRGEEMQMQADMYNIFHGNYVSYNTKELLEMLKVSMYLHTHRFDRADDDYLEVSVSSLCEWFDISPKQHTNRDRIRAIIERMRLAERIVIMDNEKVERNGKVRIIRKYGVERVFGVIYVGISNKPKPNKDVDDIFYFEITNEFLSAGYSKFPTQLIESGNFQEIAAYKTIQTVTSESTREGHINKLAMQSRQGKREKDKAKPFDDAVENVVEDYTILNMELKGKGKRTKYNFTPKEPTPKKGK